MASLLTTWRDTRAARRPAAVAAPAPTLPEVPTRDILTIDDYANAVGDLVYGGASSFGFGPSQVNWQYEPAERVSHSFEGYARSLYEGNGLVYAIMGVRILAFSLVRFSFQAMRGGRPGKLYGTPALGQLERPWVGGTTQDLLMRIMLDADIAGNAYVTKATGPDGPEVIRLRPDWVQIILMPIILPDGAIVGWRRVGYTYHDGGIDICPPEHVALFSTNEVAHFAPRPAPGAIYRGESWMTAAIREITNDKMMERHKTKYFENAATPNISVALHESITPEAFAEFKEKMNIEHRGWENAYKTLFLGGGADVQVIGATLDKINFASLQGRGETRVAAIAGVPPIIVGLSEGLSSSTYSNYGQAMRRFGDLTMASLWGNVAGSLATIVPPPGSDSRLWYDARDVAFLREDAAQRAAVEAQKASTINIYITAGFTPESAVDAVEAEDPTLLVHTGLVSVQLQPPGQAAEPAANPAPAADPPAAPPAADAAGGRTDPPAPARRDIALTVDRTDRALMYANAHPHPALAATNGNHHREG